MHPFAYTRARDLGEALNLLKTEPDAQILAGGMSLIPALKLRLAAATHLVDIADVPGLTSVSTNNNEISIGAMITHHEIASSSEIGKALPTLSTVAGSIGDPMVRNRGTLGGSLANADPSADYAAVVLGLNAVIVTDRREIKADEFFTGLYETALERTEIITRVRFPIPRRAGYAKVRQQASRFAVVGVFVAQFNGSVRVAVTGAAQNAFRQLNFEHALAKNFDATAIHDLHANPAHLQSDMHADAAYRANLIRRLCQRAITSSDGL